MSRATGVMMVGVLLVAASAVAGCAGSSSSSSKAGSAPAIAVPAAQDGGVAIGAPPTVHRSALGYAKKGEATVGAKSTLTGIDLGAGGPLVVQTARLSLRFGHKQFAGTIDRIRGIALAAGGYVVSSSVFGQTTRSGSVVLRVPSDRFGPVVGQLEGLRGAHVTAQSQRSQDVTAQYVDLSARAANLRAQELVLLRLMNRAKTVVDTIRVEDELSQVQGYLEELQGRIRYLRNQSAMATITLNIDQAGLAAPVHHHASAIGKALREAGDRALGVVTATIAGAGVVLPIALLLGLAYLVGRPIYRRWERRTAAPEAG